MDNTEIKKELAKRGFDYSMLAAALQKSPSLVSKVAARKARSQVVAQAIAKAIGKPIEEVFPDIHAYHSPVVSAELKQQKQAELIALLNDRDA
ncbi:DNA-binding protein [Pseudidiomarina aestuarii]|uniref:DNA-binding protein n=1 Tax=Pseudidiomarina aestuarii TaxID=624146 RepID=A0A2T4CUJ2_9GAMM|nr:DNA-binding protein [Pseudidiomarina aestuarii]PTB85223.1 DNA-binding protein [Pseudidiomarina aestuarii]PTB88948.1 DNA-binding protein [Pseudidiomarina aestuarii]PTB99245.1 DNA-binding protein [Marinobacter sp. Z-F4-2]